MPSSFKVEVLTPEGQVFADEVEMVSTRTTTGSIGIRANHAPLMAILEPTELRLYKSDSDVVRFAQGEGYLQVVENTALVLVEEGDSGYAPPVTLILSAPGAARVVQVSDEQNRGGQR